MNELLNMIFEVASGKYVCKPYRIKSNSIELNKAIEKLSDEIEREYPALPNLRWVALRLLEGDQSIIDAIRTGDLGNLKKEKMEAAGKLFFEIRIGVHTGTVVAGIVGVKKFAYDIWGDTVNTASRMESSGEVGKVNISGTTYELVKDKFNCVHRGKVQAKGKGEIDMYFVSQI